MLWMCGQVIEEITLPTTLTTGCLHAVLLLDIQALSQSLSEPTLRNIKHELAALFGEESPCGSPTELQLSRVESNWVAHLSPGKPGSVVRLEVLFFVD